MPASATKQVPPAHDHEFVAGNPYDFTVTVTTPGVTITNPVLTLKTGGGDPVTTNLPTVGQAGQVTTVAFDTVDSAAMNTTKLDKRYGYSLQAVVNGDGPYELVARQITVRPVGSSIVTQSADQVNLDVTVGGVAISLDVTIGGGASGNIDGGSFDSVYGGTSGVDGGTF